MRPMLADDYIESKLVFPLCLQPKIDGVRAVHFLGKLTGRSLKPFGNRYTNRFFGHSAFAGFDGEMVAAESTHPALCRLTTSALSSHSGEPSIVWWLFDYATPETVRLPYRQRYEALQHRVRQLKFSTDPDIRERTNSLAVVPTLLVHSLAELNQQNEYLLDAGYEGSIVRRPDMPYKSGRSTPTEGGLLRIKQFVEEEAVVNAVVEGRSNQNEATINELGMTERSTHQANMVPNGMVGSLECTDVKTGKPITVAAGSMTHDERILYLRQPHLIVGKTIKYKTFPKGVKDKPRFPTFQTIRMPEDMS